MKNKKLILIPGLLIFVLLVVVIIIFWKKHELYEKYRIPNEEVYGKELYSEILYACSEYESKIGKGVLDKAVQVAEYKGTKEGAENEIGDVGALSRYYYFDTKRAVAQETSFQFITCKITGNEGHVWVGTTILRFDENGENAGGGGSDMLSLWYIENRDGEWHVVKVFDTP